jgi:integral membrane sensor domain MASE1
MPADITIKKILPSWAIILASSLLYFGSALFSILGTANSLFAPFWYANAFGLLCLQLVHKNHTVLALLSLGIANFSANIVGGYGFVSSAVFVPGNMTEIWLASLLIGRYSNLSSAFLSASEFIKLIVYCILIPTILGATVGSSLLFAYRIAPFFDSFITWFIGDLFGYILVYPLSYSLLCDFRLKSEDANKSSPSFSSIAYPKYKVWSVNLLIIVTSLGVAYYFLSHTNAPFLAIATVSAFASVVLDFRTATL